MRVRCRRQEQRFRETDFTLCANSGTGYTGPTVCASPYVCTYSNDFYRYAYDEGLSSSLRTELSLPNPLANASKSSVRCRLFIDRGLQMYLFGFQWMHLTSLNLSHFEHAVTHSSDKLQFSIYHQDCHTDYKGGQPVEHYTRLT